MRDILPVLSVGCILVLVAASGCAPSEEPMRRTFRVADHGPHRHRLVLDGFLLSGDVVVEERGESLFVGGILHEPRPKPIPGPPWGTVLEPADSIRMLEIPWIAHRARKGEPLLPIVNAYFAERARMAFAALRAFRDMPGDSLAADRVARPLLDTTIVEARPGLPHSPHFHKGSVNLWHHGYGWEEYMAGMPAAPPTPPPPPGTRARVFAEPFADTMRSCVVFIGAGSITYSGGDQALLAAEQIDAAFDPDSARGVRRLAELNRDPQGGMLGSRLDALRARPAAEVLRSRR